MKTLRVLSAMMVWVVIASLVASCAPPATPEPTEAPPEAPTEAPPEAPPEATEVPPPEKRTLRVTFSWPTYIDPAVGSDFSSSSSLCNLYDTLVFPTTAGGVEPHVAESWEV